MPQPLEALLLDWELTPVGEPVIGPDALRVEVRTGRGVPATLKLGHPGAGSEHEHLALTHWHGTGAVRLYRADPRRRALLLEWLPGGSLEDAWDLEACAVVAGLYETLHVPAFRPLPQLSEVTLATRDALRELPRNAPIPRRLVEQAIALSADLARDPGTDGTLVHGDLHYATVRRDEEGTWRAIDPEPLSGDPHYEPAPLLFHRFEELAGDVRGGVRRRFHTILDTAGLDEDRARDWVVVRMVGQALGLLGSGPAPGAAAALTRCIAVAKAVQE